MFAIYLRGYLQIFARYLHICKDVLCSSPDAGLAEKAVVETQFNRLPRRKKIGILSQCNFVTLKYSITKWNVA